MAEHTQGKLYVSRSSDSAAIYGENEIVGAAHGGTLQRAQANARRLVAAWNACQGWETEVLEDSEVSLLKAKESPVAE